MVFGASSSKTTLASIHLLPSFEYLEMIQVDKSTGQILSKDSVVVDFMDQAARTISDVNQFSAAVRHLYEQTKTPLTTPTVFVLPSYYTREYELPDGFNDKEVEMLLVSETERAVMFRKLDPQVAWLKLPTVEAGSPPRLLFTACPKPDIDRIIDVFNEHHIPLVTIESGITAVMRGLLTTGAITDVVDDKATWLLTVLTNNSILCAMLEGVQIVRMQESPLSILDADAEDSLRDIVYDFTNFTNDATYSKWVLINHTDKITNSEFIEAVPSESDVIPIEQNSHTLDSLGALNPEYPCSIESIGGAFYSQIPQPSLGLLPKGRENTNAALELRQKIIKGLWVLNAAAAGVGLITWGVMTALLWSKENELQQLNNVVSASLDQASVTQMSFDEAKRKFFVKDHLDSNSLINDLVVRIGTTLPQDTWIEHIQVNKKPDDPKVVEVDIKGSALTPEVVDQFRNKLVEATKKIELIVGEINLAQSASAEAGSGGSPDAAAGNVSPTGDMSIYKWVIQTKPSTEDATAAGGAH
jgi:hypothetical protein